MNPKDLIGLHDLLRAHALIVSRAARAQIIVSAMLALNEYRDRRGESQAYDEAAILSVIDSALIEENDVLAVLNGR